MTPLLPWFYDRKQQAICYLEDSETQIVCQILDEELADTIVYAVNCLAKSYTDKASAWSHLPTRHEIDRDEALDSIGWFGK